MRLLNRAGREGANHGGMAQGRRKNAPPAGRAITGGSGPGTNPEGSGHHGPPAWRKQWPGTETGHREKGKGWAPCPVYAGGTSTTQPQGGAHEHRPHAEAFELPRSAVGHVEDAPRANSRSTAHRDAASAACCSSEGNTGAAVATRLHAWVSCSSTSGGWSLGRHTISKNTTRRSISALKARSSASTWSFVSLISSRLLHSHRPRHVNHGPAGRVGPGRVRHSHPAHIGPQLFARGGALQGLFNGWISLQRRLTALGEQLVQVLLVQTERTRRCMAILSADSGRLLGHAAHSSHLLGSVASVLHWTPHRDSLTITP